MRQARNVVVGLVAAAGMLVAGPIGASANISWCIADPPVGVVSPGGQNLTVSTQVFLPPNSQHLKGQIQDQAVTSPDVNGGTLIAVYVTVPVQSHVVASVNRFGVSAQADGSGVVTLYLHVPVS